MCNVFLVFNKLRCYLLRGLRMVKPKSTCILFFFIIISMLLSCKGKDPKSLSDTFHTTTIAQTHVSYPRLFGMNIGSKNYSDSGYLNLLSQLDVVILDFYKDWKNNGLDIKDVITELKSRNRNILVGQYTILNEMHEDSTDLAKRDILNKIESHGWWLLNSKGEKVQWTDAYNSWEINISDWVTPDKNGHYFPEWIARRNYNVFFSQNPFDIWYFDNVFYKARVLADWDNDGIDDDPNSSSIKEIVRAAHVKEWTTAKLLKPEIYLAGNVDHNLSIPSYQYKLNGAFLEGLMGKSWSLETLQGWEHMMNHYHEVMGNTIFPHLVSFNVWGSITDYKFMRYALTSCLLNNGYFTFTDENVGYSSVPWFDEFDISLGLPIEPPQYVQDGITIYKRKFQNGLVLVNPTNSSQSVNVETGYTRFPGLQDPNVNNGKPISELTIPAKDGMVLIKKLEKKRIQVPENKFSSDHTDLSQ